MPACAGMTFLKRCQHFSRRSINRYPSLMLAVLCAVWGLTFPLTKAAVGATTPLQFLSLRFGLGILLLAPFVRLWPPLNIGQMKRLGGREWRWVIVVGLLMAVGFALQATGMRYTTASRSGFFTGLLTIFAPIIAALFHTSKAPWTTWIGVPVAMAGVYLLASPEAGGLNRGDILTIACALVFAFQMVALEVADKAGRARGVDPTGALLLSQVVVTGILCIAGALIEGESWHVSSAGWWGVGYTALFGTVIAIYMQTRFQPLVPAGHAALVYTLEPLFAASFAAILLGDRWTTSGFLGAGLILAAMAISSVGMARSSREPAK